MLFSAQPCGLKRNMTSAHAPQQQYARQPAATIQPLLTKYVALKIANQLPTKITGATCYQVALQHSMFVSKTGVVRRAPLPTFLALLSSGWGLLSVPYANVHNSYRFMLNRDTLRFHQQMRVIRQRLIKQADKHDNYRTRSNHFQAYAQFINISNLIQMLDRSAVAQVFPLYFNEPQHVRALSYSNWRATRVSATNWPVLRYLFFFKLQRDYARKFMLAMSLNAHILFFFFINPVYHASELRTAQDLNLPTGSLTNLLQEPWISDYPVFCDGTNPSLVTLFVGLVA